MSETGYFAGIFNVLAALIGILGITVTTLGLSGLWAPDWSAGAAVVTDALILGALLIVMSVGFATFGIMIKKEGWDKADASETKH